MHSSTLRSSHINRPQLHRLCVLTKSQFIKGSGSVRTGQLGQPLYTDGPSLNSLDGQLQGGFAGLRPNIQKRFVNGQLVGRRQGTGRMPRPLPLATETRTVTRKRYWKIIMCCCFARFEIQKWTLVLLFHSFSFLFIPFNRACQSETASQSSPLTP
jgi:hypothetical protein